VPCYELLCVSANLVVESEVKVSTHGDRRGHAQRERPLETVPEAVNEPDDGW
jgi:hypothetical protein